MTQAISGEYYATPATLTDRGKQILRINSKGALVTSVEDSSGNAAGAGTLGSPTYVASSNPATIVTGQLALAAGTRSQMPSVALTNGIVIKSDAANTAKVLIGGSTVTATADGTGTGYILAPGEAVSFGVANASAIYAISSATAVLSYQGN